MQKYLLSPTLACFTFLIGLALAISCFYYLTATVSLTDLEQHPNRYQGRVVRVKANAVAMYTATFILERDCKINFPAVIVPTEEGFVPSPQVQTFINQSAHNECQAEVVVVGKFDQYYGQGCFAPRFGIIPKTIELTTEVTTGRPLRELERGQ